MTLTIFKPAYWMRIQSLIRRRTLTCEENNEIKWITWLCRLTGYRRARLCAFTSFIYYVVAALFTLFHLNKTRWIPHIRPCLCWLWHGAWTCFLTRSKDWGTVRETCLCVSATTWKGVRSLSNTAAPVLPIFNNHLEERGCFAAPSAFVAKIWKIEHALFCILEKDKLLIFTDALMDAI